MHTEDTVFYKDVFFVDENIGWVTNNITENYRKLYKTTNGGINWNTLISVNNQESYVSLFFCNDSVGFTATLNSLVGGCGLYKTTDGGMSWFGSYGLTGIHLGMFFVNPRVGWIVGDNNQIFKTSNSGLNWTNQSITPFPILDFYSCYFVDSLTGWVMQGGSTVYHTTSGGLTGFSNVPSEIPDKYFLSQNYPNPFNPTTIISYALPVSGYVSLKVYDVNGSLISTLINAEQNPGEYKSEFDGRALASGVYFYTMEVNRKIKDTKRMILIK